jgi:hypothetical protein
MRHRAHLVAAAPPGGVMPLVRPCRRRWCPSYADDSGFCDEHRPATRYPGYPPMPPDWPERRAAQVAAHPVCQDCGQAPATDVHHVRGRAAGDGPDNLRSLCSHCHAVVTGREGGMAWP